MSVYQPKGSRTWWYDFTWKKTRYRASTQQLREEDAALVEARIKLALRQESGGIAPFDVNSTPRFSVFAETFYRYQVRFLDRPDLVRRALEVVLEFWGAAPQRPKRLPSGWKAPRVPPPYYDLRLGHPIADPSWITRFEQWIEARRVSGSTRNTYLSIMSGIYKVARQPEYRAMTRVPSNPFDDIRRSPTQGRLVALEREDVLRWVRAAAPHVRTAMAIAALAPKMRLQSILDLEWALHFDRELTRIVNARHKTRRASGLPQVTPIDAQLHDILVGMRAAAQVAAQRAKKPRPDLLRYVITFQGRHVKSIKKATKRAAENAGLKWGVRDGVTFHTLRHSVATLLAELGIGERLRMELMGHRVMATTQKYTHLAAHTQIGPHAQLSAVLPLKDIILPPLGETEPLRPRDLRKVAGKRGLALARRSR